MQGIDRRGAVAGNAARDPRRRQAGECCLSAANGGCTGKDIPEARRAGTIRRHQCQPVGGSPGDGHWCYSHGVPCPGYRVGDGAGRQQRIGIGARTGVESDHHRRSRVARIEIHDELIDCPGARRRIAERLGRPSAEAVIVCFDSVVADQGGRCHGGGSWRRCRGVRRQWRRRDRGGCGRGRRGSAGRRSPRRRR